MKKAIRWMVTVVVIAALAGGGFYAYQKYYLPEKNAINISTLQVVKLGTGSVSQTISSTGTVRTRQTVQVVWQASGKVGKINVKVGDQVKAGQVLASLNAGFLPNNILAAQQNLVTDQQALDDLLNSQITVPTAQKAVLDAQTALTTAQNARDLLNSERGTPFQIANAQATYLQSLDRLNQMQAIYDSKSGDPTTDSAKALALTNLVNAKANLNTALVQLQWIQAKPTANDLAAADNALALAKAKLADAQTALTQAQNGADSSTMIAARQKIAADQAITQFQSINSSINGTVTQIDNMIGDDVSTGTTAFRVDDMSASYVDLLVVETDIAKVQVGQPVTFTFDAIPGKTYNGTVTSVGQVGTMVSGVVSFTVTAQITDADASVKPGMTATGNIIVASLNNVMVVPARAIHTVNNRQVVYMLSATPVTQITSVPAAGSGTGAAGTGAGGTQRTRTAGTGAGATGAGTGTGSAGSAAAGTGAGTTSGGTGTGGASTGPGTGGTGAAGGFAGNFSRTTLSPIATTNGESLIPITVQVGIAGDTFTQIITTRLKVGEMIVLNMPSSAIASVSSSTTTGAGLFGGGIRVAAPAGGGGGFRGGG